MNDTYTYRHNKPFFSIILPFFNAKDTLRLACHSCLAQTLKDFELILVDDGSSDGFINCIGDLIRQDQRIKLISLPVNSGVSKARNAGINQARGKYLAFIDADDQWDCNKLYVMAEVILSRPDISFLFHDSRVGFANLSNNVGMSYEASTELVPFSLWLLKNRAHTPSVVVKNDHFVRFNESLQYSEDYDLWLKLAFSGGSLRVKRVLTYLGRRVGSPGGLSGKRWSMRLGEIRCYLRLYRLHPLFALVTPALVVWSFAKHVRSIICTNRL